MHLAFAYGLGMEIPESAHFFSRFFENWLPRAYYFFEKEISKQELEKRKKETLSAFEKSYKSQKNVLVPFFKTVWNALTNNEEFEQEWLNRWVNDMNIIGGRLRDIQKQGVLEPQKWYMQQKTDQFPVQNQELWVVYDSYVHMTNNRLGILNRDEAYLAYLMMEVMKEL